MAKGTLALRQIQLGDNADTSKNFVISVPAVADGTLVIERGNGADVLSIAADGTVAISGTPTNSNAASGVVGEVKTDDTTSTPLSLTSSTARTIAAVTLSPGDWDVTGIATFTPAATTNMTQESVAVSLVDDALSGNSTRQPHLAFVPNATTRISAPMTRISVAATTIVYLTASASFTVSTLTCGGYLYARRVR